MIIKAKYDSLYRPYMKTEVQGFGSLYGGNQSSVVSNNNQEQSLEFTNESGEIGKSAAYSKAFSEEFDSYNFIK